MACAMHCQGGTDFNPDAVSVAGAMGLMQIMQDIARHYGVTDPLQPEANLRAGIKHFRALMDISPTTQCSPSQRTMPASDE